MKRRVKSRHGQALVDQINVKFDASPTDQLARAMASQLSGKRGNLSSAVKLFLCALAQVQQQTGVEVTMEMLGGDMLMRALVGLPVGQPPPREEPDIIWTGSPGWQRLSTESEAITQQFASAESAVLAAAEQAVAGEQAKLAQVGPKPQL